MLKAIKLYQSFTLHRKIARTYLIFVFIWKLFIIFQFHIPQQHNLHKHLHEIEMCIAPQTEILKELNICYPTTPPPPPPLPYFHNHKINLLHNVFSLYIHRCYVSISMYMRKP